MTSAPAKVILCGEHAVVYGRPAIALPLADLRAEALISPAAPGSGLHLHAPDLGQSWIVAAHPTHPLSELALATLDHLAQPEPDLVLTLHSQIPLASGMGSGAAIATALVRALSGAFGVSLTPDVISKLVYASERRFHGTPSGIDNTVIAYEQALWFVRASTPDAAPTLEPLEIGAPLTLVLGDTGVRSATRLPVGAVRAAWQADPARYEALFTAIGALAIQARAALASGDQRTLGAILDANQAYLSELGVSSPELNRLVAVARAAGALGAKLAGAGWGGIMLALVEPDQAQHLAAALRAADAAQVFITSV